jgi:hypothetical protein
MPIPRCRYCFSRLANGAAYCDDNCRDGMWWIVPTLDGSIAGEDEPFKAMDDPDEPEPELIIIPGPPPTRPSLELPPEPHEAACAADRAYIDATRLRQRLIEAGL